MCSCTNEKIDKGKNTSEGQQHTFGKALYISCRRYGEEENERVNRRGETSLLSTCLLLEGKPSQRYNETYQKIIQVS